MATLLTVPSAIYTIGTRTVATPADIDPALQSCSIQLTLESWPVVPPDAANPDGACIAFAIDWSPDSGASFFQLLSGRMPGFAVQPINPRTGLPILHTDTFISLPQVGNTNRRLRATVQNFAAITTAITLQAS